MGHAETSIRNDCLDLLHRRGFYARNNPLGLFRPYKGRVPITIGKAGEYDILAIGPNGVLLWVETKTPKGKDRDAQPVFLENMTQRGVACVKVRSVEELQTYLDENRDRFDDCIPF